MGGTVTSLLALSVMLSCTSKKAEGHNGATLLRHKYYLLIASTWPGMLEDGTRKVEKDCENIFLIRTKWSAKYDAGQLLFPVIILQYIMAKRADTPV